MRLVSYEQDGRLLPGFVIEGSVFDAQALLQRRGVELGAGELTMPSLLAAFAGRLPSLASILENPHDVADARVGGTPYVRLGPPVPNPGKVLCVGLNYNDHLTETGRALPSHPDIFAKFASTLIGPSDDIRLAEVTDNLDFEGELAVVIGKSVRNAGPGAALDAVAGLMVLNDVTARDLQYRGTQWIPGKCVDDSTPCGPWIVTLDEIPDPQDLNLTTWVNDQVVQHSNTRYMIFPIAEIVSYISGFLTLQPGDVIATGTPAGIGAKREPPMWLRPGDHVRVEIEQVGSLSNAIR